MPKPKREPIKPKLERNTALEAEFHKYYYGNPSKIEGTTGNDCWALWDCPRWLGTKCIQFPFDLIVLQEIIWDCRPDFIVECGTAKGGTTLFLASMCELVRHGTVLSIDTNRDERPPHPGIIYRNCSSLDPELLAQLKEVRDAGRSLMVILDSDHSKEHVLKELDAYGPLVTPASSDGKLRAQYMLIHDMNMPLVFPEYGPGPFEAVQEWEPSKHGFAVDHRRERFGGISYYCGGFLLKVKEVAHT